MLSLIITYWNKLKNTFTKRREQMADFNIQDELLAMELPEMLSMIGQAVNKANQEAGEFYIPEAEAEIRIAIHVEKETGGGAEVSGKIYGVGINASYQSQYGYSAEGSSLIKLKFKAGPKPAASD
jgi:hypothetical protein